MQYTKFLIAFLIILLSACSKQTIKDDSLSIAPIRYNIPENIIISDSEHRNFLLAIQAMEQNKLGDAEKLLREFINKRNDLAGPWANLALIYFKQGKSEDALKAIEQSLAKNPNHAGSLNLLALIEHKQGKLKDAIEHYKAAIKAKPDYANAHYNLALLYDIYYQEIEKAVEYYRKYMALIQHEDKITADWLEQLQNSLNNS